MPVITINNEYGELGDGHIQLSQEVYLRQWLACAFVGYYHDPGIKIPYYYRAYRKFPLTDLPADANVTKVRIWVRCDAVGGAAHLLDIHPFGGNGQPDTAGDEQTCYNNCAAGTPYVDDSIELRTLNGKWFTLGDGEAAQACIDVENAKAAVNRFSLGFHEEGDNDERACLVTTSILVYSVLEITYEVPVPPVGYQYGDGLVSVQVG